MKSRRWRAAGLLTGLAAVVGSVGAGQSPGGRGPDILVVSIDTLRADRVGALGNTRGLTPTLDRLAADSVVFEQAWSQANVTNMSHGSLFTSRFPSELGEAGQFFRLPPGVPTLAEVMSLYGYATAAFTAGGHLGPGFGMERGFATFQAAADMSSFWSTVPAALDWVDARQGDQPFLLFVHSYDCHAPYLHPSPYGTAWADPAYVGAATEVLESFDGTDRIFGNTLFHDANKLSFLRERPRARAWDADARKALLAGTSEAAQRTLPFGEADNRRVQDAYDGAVGYADAWLDVLLSGLDARGRLENTVVIVLSDHGESLGEQGLYGHGQMMVDEELHVPLIVHVPGAASRHVAAPVTLLDVLPTVIDLAASPASGEDLPVAPAQARGHSLAPWVRGEQGTSWPVQFAEGNWRAISARGEAGRLTFSGLSAHTPYLMGLLAWADPAGPAFATDSTAKDPRALRQALLDWRGSLVPAGPRVPADPHAVDAMQRQGYWGP